MQAYAYKILQRNFTFPTAIVAIEELTLYHCHNDWTGVIIRNRSKKQLPPFALYLKYYIRPIVIHEKSNPNHTYHNTKFRKIRKYMYLAENNTTCCSTYHNDIERVAWNFSSPLSPLPLPVLSKVSLGVCKALPLPFHTL